MTHNETSILMVIPCYNEIANLDAALARLSEAMPTADVLVVDDASPDGTGVRADEIAARDHRVHVLHRTGKNGLGSAYLEGFAWGLERGYDVLGEMDADLSHPADALPRMLEALGGDDSDVGLVIGSRWIEGGSVVDWPESRRRLSVAGNAYVRLALGLDVHDATAGFRLFRATTLRTIGLDAVESKGYCFQIDMTLRTIDTGWRIAEVPIEFRERAAGVSKMNNSIIVEAMSRVTLWGVARRWRRLVSPPSRRVLSTPSEPRQSVGTL